MVELFAGYLGVERNTLYALAFLFVILPSWVLVYKFDLLRFWPLLLAMGIFGYVTIINAEIWSHKLGILETALLEETGWLFGLIGFGPLLVKIVWSTSDDDDDVFYDDFD